jgi:hypothetical protein
LAARNLVLQATICDCLAFDPFAFEEEGLSAPEVDVSRSEIVEALVIAGMVVVLDEAGRRGERRSAGHPSTPRRGGIRADLRAGRAGIMKLAGLHGVGVGTVQRIKVALAG